MKKLFFPLLLCLMAISCTKQQGDFRLALQLTDVPDTLVVITSDDSELGFAVDSLILNNGKAEYTLSIDELTPLYVIDPAALFGMGNFMCNLPALPGENVKIKGNADDITFSGSKFYKGYSDLFDMVNTATDAQDLEQMTEQFINEHKNQEIAAYAIAEVMAKVNPAKAIEMADEIKPEIRNGRLGSYIDEAIERAQEDVETQAKAESVQAPGALAPDFELTDNHGKTLRLSDLRGQYVVLDFWGSWCKWCIKGIPQMKEYYTKYKGKFEIIGIDNRDEKGEWLEALQEYDMPWLHVYNPDESTLCDDYAIEGFPTKIIIDPDGYVVKTIVGEDPEFYDILDQLFQ